MKYLLPLAFIGMPIAEIAVFIQVGSLIGLWPTLLAIIVTAVVGMILIRRQGGMALAEAQAKLDGGKLPVDSVVHGVFLLFAGVLLLTPGFITDAAGFALLVAPIRLALARWLLERVRGSDRVHIHMGGFGAKTTRPPDPQHGTGPVIEGRIRPADGDGNDGAGRGSPWRH